MFYTPENKRMTGWKEQPWKKWVEKEWVDVSPVKKSGWIFQLSILVTGGILDITKSTNQPLCFDLVHAWNIQLIIKIKGDSGDSQ